ncbi:MAG: tetratricopeptide repeat protein [Isosphaerales bacterium]
MTTTSDVAALSEHPLAPAAGGPVVAAAGRRKPTLAWKLIGVCLLACLSAFNVWWYWRDNQPLPDLKTISGWISREQYPQAESALREYVRRSPHDGEARMMLARALGVRGDLLDCARQLHEVPYWWPQKAEALLREGQSYLTINRAKDAERAWLEAIKDDPLHPVTPDVLHDACQELLQLYAIEDRWEDAYPVIWVAYDHAAPVDQPILLAMRMRPELERVSQKESISLLTRYVAAAADDWEALRALARAELALGHHAEAARHFQACLKGRPDDVRAWRDYLTMLLEQGDLNAFLALLAKAPRSAETEPETWMFHGVASEKAGEWQTAAEDFRKAIELNPNVPKYHYRLAMAEERLGLHEQALAHRKRTKEMNDARAQLPTAYADYFASIPPRKAGAPDMAVACKRLASICETMGWSRAAQAWNRLAISP